MGFFLWSFYGELVYCLKCIWNNNTYIFPIKSSGMNFFSQEQSYRILTTASHARRRWIWVHKYVQSAKKSNVTFKRVEITVKWGHGTLLLWAAAKEIIVHITASFEDGRKSIVYRSICGCCETTQSRYETKRIRTQLTQITFISAANCEGLRVTQTRGIRGGRGHLCDITVSLTHPSGREWEVKALTLDDREFTVVCTHKRRTHDNLLLFTDLNKISHQSRHICLNTALGTKTQRHSHCN